MIFDRTGAATEGFHALGLAQVPTYLLEAPRPALFDAGFSCLGPWYARDARRVLGPRQPAYLFLTHVHFDHCGAAAQLKRAFPGLKVAASRRAAEIMARPNALALMERLNHAAAEQVRAWAPELGETPGFEPFEVDLVLEDGQEVDLGDGLTVRALATPGHTWDFMSYHVPQRDILVASEAVGCADGTGYVVSEFLVDYDAYVGSLRRLAGLGARVLCQGHRLIYLDEAVDEYIARSLQAAADYKEWVESLLEQEDGDLERVAQRVRAQEYDPRPQPKQPLPAYLLNLRARVGHLAQRRAAALAGRLGSASA